MDGKEVVSYSGHLKCALATGDRTVDKQAFDDVWELFLEQLVVAPSKNDPLLKPKNFLGSVEKHKKKFDVAVQKFLGGERPNPDLDSW